MKGLAIFLLSALFFATGVFSHPGGTDASGCHTNQKTKRRHCHEGKKAKKTSRSAKKANMGKQAIKKKKKRKTVKKSKKKKAKKKRSE